MNSWQTNRQIHGKCVSPRTQEVNCFAALHKYLWSEQVAVISVETLWGPGSPCKMEFIPKTPQQCNFSCMGKGMTCPFPTPGGLKAITSTLCPNSQIYIESTPQNHLLTDHREIPKEDSKVACLPLPDRQVWVWVKSGFREFSNFI